MHRMKFVLLQAQQSVDLDLDQRLMQASCWLLTSHNPVIPIEEPRVGVVQKRIESKLSVSEIRDNHSHHDY